MENARILVAGKIGVNYRYNSKNQRFFIIPHRKFHKNAYNYRYSSKNVESHENNSRLKRKVCYITAIAVKIEGEMNSTEMGNMLRYCRRQSGLSQLQLAKLAGVGKTAVFDIENGKETVQFDTLLKIFEVLNIRVKFETPFPLPETIEDNK